VGHLKNILQKIMLLLKLDSADSAPSVLRDFMTSLGAEPLMEKLGADATDQRLFLSKQINMQRMSNNPVALSPNNIEKIFRL